MIETTLASLAERVSLDSQTVQKTVSAVLKGECSDIEIAALLTALRIKGETIDEVVGAVRALRAHVTPIQHKHDVLLDTCGTGGDGLHTFNISTATALVVAACGVPIAKHGNRGISSSSGSADVLRELGVNIEADVPTVERCLDQLNLGFCYAPLLHTAMKHVAPVRRALRFRTLFNLLGPLTNPAGADFQLLGTSQPEIGEKLAQSLCQLGCKRAFVICGMDGLDEVSLNDATRVWEVNPGNSDNPIASFTWTHEDFDLPSRSLQEIEVDSPSASAGVITAVLEGQQNAARDVILANSAAALYLVGKVDSLPSGVHKAAAIIDTGSAQTLLNHLSEMSHVGQN